MTVQPAPFTRSLSIIEFVYDWSVRLQLSCLWINVDKSWVLPGIDSAKKMFEITNFSNLLAVALLQDNNRDFVVLGQSFHSADLSGGKALYILFQYVGLSNFPSRIVPINSSLIHICHAAGSMVYPCNCGTACCLSFLLSV